MKTLSKYEIEFTMIINENICNAYNSIKLFMTKTFLKIHIYIY